MVRTGSKPVQTGRFPDLLFLEPVLFYWFYSTGSNYNLVSNGLVHHDEPNRLVPSERRFELVRLNRSAGGISGRMRFQHPSTKSFSLLRKTNFVEKMVTLRIVVIRMLKKKIRSDGRKCLKKMPQNHRRQNEGYFFGRSSFFSGNWPES